MAHISVMIPVYNHAHFVERTIESVLRQSYRDIEVVVVDDASTDNTIEVVKELEHQDSRLKLLVNEYNLGLTQNWNRCLALATGSLVQIMQSDDLIDRDYLERVVKIFDTYPEVGFVGAGCRYINSQDEVINPGTAKPARLYKAGNEAIAGILSGGFPHVSSIVTRRECYETLGGLREDIWHGPDVEMDARLASRYDFYHLGGVYTSFRRHGTNRANLEYLRQDFLSVHMLKMKLAWGYLSREGRRRLVGTDDLDRYVSCDAAKVAIGGAIVTIAYERRDLARYYLEQAVKLDRRTLCKLRFWKALGLFLLPGIGKTVMQHRMKILPQDLNHTRLAVR